MKNFLIYLSATPEQAYHILMENKNHEYRSSYEQIIKKDPVFAYRYAKIIIRRRWKEAEEYIKKDPRYAFYYAESVIKGRWKEAEEYIEKDPEWSYFYALNIMNDESFWLKKNDAQILK